MEAKLVISQPFLQLRLARKSAQKGLVVVVITMQRLRQYSVRSHNSIRNHTNIRSPNNIRSHKLVLVGVGVVARQPRTGV